MNSRPVETYNIENERTANDVPAFNVYLESTGVKLPLPLGVLTDIQKVGEGCVWEAWFNGEHVYIISSPEFEAELKRLRIA